ncbi:TPA: hypothetical protein DEP58_04950 [Patescibacteria group bacterium]|nr:hypothetical protein [Patescibacteria group bacterium]
MREKPMPDYEVRVDGTRSEIAGRKVRPRWQHRMQVHVIVFIVSFIFTAGFLVLGVLLWVRPDTLLPILAVGLLSSAVFVISFASLRMMILHGLFDEYPNKEEDPGLAHHVSKSIVYGFIALVVAIIIAGMLIKIASAQIF